MFRRGRLPSLGLQITQHRIVLGIRLLTIFSNFSFPKYLELKRSTQLRTFCRHHFG